MANNQAAQIKDRKLATRYAVFGEREDPKVEWLLSGLVTGDR